MEPFESHIEQKEAVYEGVTVRQIRRKMKTVDHEIQRLDACAEKHEDHEYGEKDLLSLVDKMSHTAVPAGEDEMPAEDRLTFVIDNVFEKE